MQKKKISIAPILFLYYEESVCSLLLNYNKVYLVSSLIAKPNKQATRAKHFEPECRCKTIANSAMKSHFCPVQNYLDLKNDKAKLYSYQVNLGSWVNMKRAIFSVCSNFRHIWMKTFFIGTQFHSIMIWGQMTLNWSFVMFDFSKAQFTLVKKFLRFKLQKLSLVRFSCKMQCS